MKKYFQSGFLSGTMPNILKPVSIASAKQAFFERMVDMARKMGLEDPLSFVMKEPQKSTACIDGKEYINFSTYDYLDINAHPGNYPGGWPKTAARFGTSARSQPRLVGGKAAASPP